MAIHADDELEYLNWEDDYQEAVGYINVCDVEARMTRTLSADEKKVCEELLDDAQVIIHAFAPAASLRVKTVVACRMVIRALGDGSSFDVPMGATQGSMGGLGYTKSWTIGSGGATGELYLSKLEKQMLGMGNRIGSRSPVEDLVCEGSKL